LEVSDQSPVYFHGVQVGEVTRHELSDRNGRVALHIFVYAPHPQLIHPDSRFWAASGLEVSIGSGGVKIGTTPLLSILAGGIVFDTPDDALGGKPSPPDSTFQLYADRKAADDAAEVRVSYRLFFPGAPRGVDVGTPVELRGRPIGQVSAVELEYDPGVGSIRIPVTIEVAPHRINMGGTPLGSSLRDPAEATNQLFADLVAKGLRAQLASANLLTGQSVIELDFIPDAPPVQFVRAEPYPELPTVEGSSIEQITRLTNKLMNKLAALPLDQLVEQIRGMIGHADSLVGNPDMKRSIRNLDLTLANTERFTRIANAQVGPLLQRLDAAADQLKSTLTILGNDPAAGNDLARTLGELKDAARSIRVLADYLERHPESLIRGKPQEASREVQRFDSAAARWHPLGMQCVAAKPLLRADRAVGLGHGEASWAPLADRGNRRGQTAGCARSAANRAAARAEPARVCRIRSLGWAARRYDATRAVGRSAVAADSEHDDGRRRFVRASRNDDRDRGVTLRCRHRRPGGSRRQLGNDGQERQARRRPARSENRRIGYEF
jgi:paraquat-inducible protein B